MPNMPNLAKVICNSKGDGHLKSNFFESKYGPKMEFPRQGRGGGEGVGGVAGVWMEWGEVQF